MCGLVVPVRDESGLAEAAQLFKVLGSESRLRLLVVLGEQPRSVGVLAEATAMSQPLVSQHLRALRQVGLVVPTRNGKEVTYAVADTHVSHVVADAVAHVQEPGRAARGDDREEAHP